MAGTHSNIPTLDNVATPTPMGAMETRPIVISSPGRPVGSPSFLMIVSTVIGIVIGTGMVVGVLGRAFFVPKEEYTAKVLKEAEEKGKLEQTLERMSVALTRQEAAFERLSETVQAIKLDMARGRIDREHRGLEDR